MARRIRVSDCIIRDTRPGAKDPIALRLTSGKANMIVNNMLTGRTEIAEDSGQVTGNNNGR